MIERQEGGDRRMLDGHYQTDIDGERMPGRFHQLRKYCQRSNDVTVVRAVARSHVSFYKNSNRMIVQCCTSGSAEKIGLFARLVVRR